MSTVAKPNRRPNYIYKTRNTGRLGNQLFEYFFWRLLALRDRKQFANEKYPHFPGPFNKLEPFVDYSNVFAIEDLRYLYYNEKIHPFPMDFKYYSPYRDLLTSFLKQEPLKKNYDIIIHVRLDDVFDEHPEYSVLPFSFYRNVFSCLKSRQKIIKKTKILIIGFPRDNIQRKILEDLCIFVENEAKCIVNIQSKSMTEDMLEIMKAPILICSTSSFWFWPSFLSNISREIHVPMFGQIKMYNYFNNLGPNDELIEEKCGSTNVKIRINYETPFRSCYAIFGYETIKKKIELNDLERMYD